MIFNSKRADIQSTELPVRWIVDSWRILEQERWAMYDSLQCGSFERRAFLSHNQFCKSAQYLRSNRGLVLCIDSADSWAVIIFKHGVIHREWASSYVEKLEEVSTYKWDEWSSSDWSTARSSQISELAGFMRKVSLECFRTTLMLIMDLEEQPGHAESTRLRHRENEHRQNWRSNSFDFEREGARTFADSQWLGHIYRGSNLLYVRAIPKVTRKGSRRQGAHAWCFRCVLFFRHVVVSCFPAGTNIWNWMGKSSELGVPCCSSKTRIILIRTCGWHYTDWKTAECEAHVEEIDEKCWSGRRDIISWPRVLGMHSTWMQTEREYHWGIYKDVRITYFCWSNGKMTGMGETSRNIGCVVLRHGRTKTWRIFYKVLKLMLGWSSIQARRRWIGARIITSVLPKCLNMFVLGTNWRTRHFLGLSANLQEQSQNGLRLAADDWPDWFRTFITQMTTDNIVMWATPFSIVDWVYSKTQTLLAWSYDAKGHAEKCVERCCDWTGKKQTSVSHSFTESETFRWMLDYEWMVYLLSIYEMYSRKLFAKSQIQTQTKGKPRCWSIDACGLPHHRRKFFSRRVSVVHLWRQRSSDQNDQRPKSNHETRAKPKIQIKYVDTRSQPADLLNTWKFTHGAMVHSFNALLGWAQLQTRRSWECLEMCSRCAFFNGLETTVFGSS